MGTPWLIVLAVIASQVALFVARDAVQKALRQLGAGIGGGLRVFGRWCRSNAQLLMQNAKELLLAHGRQAAERKLEREFARVNDGFARELGKYPALHQSLAKSTERLATDIAQSADVPPSVPGWPKALESATKLPEMPDRSLKKVLEEIRDGATGAEKRALEDYRKAAAERHKILRGMGPVVKDVNAALGSTLSAVKRALELSTRVDAHIEKYEQICAAQPSASRALAADAVVTFVIALVVMAVAIGGAFVNFQLIALPMAELVPTTARVAGLPVSSIAALVLVLMEAAAGLFLMEALGITELFPRVGALQTRQRRLILGLSLVCLLVFAGLEATLAILREQIVEADMALKLQLSGHAGAKPAFSSVPLIGQAVLGFMLPWLLALVALPLEMLITSGRHVAVSIVALLLGFCGVVARVIGRIAEHLMRAAAALLDVYIAIPLLISRSIPRRPEPPRIVRVKEGAR